MKDAIQSAIDFINALPDEITWVSVCDDPETTVTVGREYVIHKLNEALGTESDQ